MDDEVVPSPERERMSFIGRLRDKKTGRMSQPRLFGGKPGASTAMTRSIGDRDAARCCISDPEITTTVVEAGDCGRIIIASDGMWDVMSIEQAETISKGFGFSGTRNPQEAAALLAQQARVAELRAAAAAFPGGGVHCVFCLQAADERQEQGMPQDDITVFVIDVRGGPRGVGGGGAARGGEAGSAAARTSSASAAEGGCCVIS